MTVITAVGFGGTPVPAILIGTSQNLSYNVAGGASAQSQAFGDNTTLIEVAAHVTGSGVRIATGTAPVASATSKLLPGSGTWFFVVAPGWKLAAISDDATTGTINICEAASLG